VIKYRRDGDHWDRTIVADGRRKLNGDAPNRRNGHYSKRARYKVILGNAIAWWQVPLVIIWIEWIGRNLGSRVEVSPVSSQRSELAP
jgi:hypothetical protein